jgi:hypothetical protein
MLLSMTTRESECFDRPQMELPSFSHLPERIIVFHALGPNNEYGSSFIDVSDGISEVTIKLFGINEASTIDNKNFDVGLAGWDLEAAPGATLEQHVELAGPQPGIGLHRSLLEGLPGDYDLVITTGGVWGEYVASHTFISPEDTTLVRVRYRFVTQ